MSQATTTKPSVSTAERTGTIMAILGLLAFAVPAGALLVGSNFTIATNDQAKSVITYGILLTGAGIFFGLVSVILSLPKMIQSAGAGRIFSAILGILVLVTSSIFMITTALPRVNALNHLNNAIVPFAKTVQANCKTVIDNTTATLTQARDDSQSNMTSDSGFVTAMTADVAILQQRDSALKSGLSVLQTLTAPDSKYNALLTDCISTVRAEEDFLSNASGPNAIPLPAPYNALVAKVSGIQLLQDAALVVSGKGPIPAPAIGTLQTLLVGALNQVIAVTNPKLTAEGDQLQSDIQNSLNTNLAPFKVTIPVK